MLPIKYKHLQMFSQFMHNYFELSTVEKSTFENVTANSLYSLFYEFLGIAPILETEDITNWFKYQGYEEAMYYYLAIRKGKTPPPKIVNNYYAKHVKKFKKFEIAEGNEVQELKPGMSVIGQYSNLDSMLRVFKLFCKTSDESKTLKSNITVLLGDLTFLYCKPNKMSTKSATKIMESLEFQTKRGYYDGKSGRPITWAIFPPEDLINASKECGLGIFRNNLGRLTDINGTLLEVYTDTQNVRIMSSLSTDRIMTSYLEAFQDYTEELIYVPKALREALLKFGYKGNYLSLEARELLESTHSWRNSSEAVEKARRTIEWIKAKAESIPLEEEPISEQLDVDEEDDYEPPATKTANETITEQKDMQNSPDSVIANALAKAAEANTSGGNIARDKNKEASKIEEAFINRGRTEDFKKIEQFEEEGIFPEQGEAEEQSFIPYERPTTDFKDLDSSDEASEKSDEEIKEVEARIFGKYHGAFNSNMDKLRVSNNTYNNNEGQSTESDTSTVYSGDGVQFGGDTNNGSDIIVDEHTGVTPELIVNSLFGSDSRDSDDSDAIESGDRHSEGLNQSSTTGSKERGEPIKGSFQYWESKLAERLADDDDED